jgi:hypothetical protein
MTFIPQVKSKKYKDFIRTRPCAFCGYPPPSEPHHIRNIDGLPTGVGNLPSDFLALPACRRPDGKSCHDEDQAYQGDLSKEDKQQLIIFHLIEYITEK